MNKQLMVNRCCATAVVAAAAWGQAALPAWGQTPMPTAAKEGRAVTPKALVVMLDGFRADAVEGAFTVNGVEVPSRTSVLATGGAPLALSGHAHVFATTVPN